MRIDSYDARLTEEWPPPYLLSDDSLVMHAGGVAKNGSALVLPAVSESGKSTLTAGLVRAGLDYLSDEAIAFRWHSCHIEPYPKPITLDPGSWHLFPELRPNGETGAEVASWQVSPDGIRPGCVAEAATARWLVFPKYTYGATTELSPIAKGEALVEACKNTFRFRDHGRRALDTLAVIVRHCDCYRLAVGSLDDAVGVVTSLMGTGHD